MGFTNEVIGGQASLVRSAIKSPNYVHSISGWTVNKDGSAEFNNVTIRGSIFGLQYILNGSGIFFYNGTPTSGNLVIALTGAAGADQFGNHYPQGLSFSGLLGPNQFQIRPDLGAFLIYG